MMDMSKEGIYPKVYLGADFADALGGLIYNSSVKFVLTSE